MFKGAVEHWNNMHKDRHDILKMLFRKEHSTFPNSLSDVIINAMQKSYPAQRRGLVYSTPQSLSPNKEHWCVTAATLEGTQVIKVMAANHPNTS